LAPGNDISEAEVLWPVLEQALVAALDALIKMRVKEGAHLAKDLQGRIKTMRKGVATIKSVAPEMVKRYREQLQQRIANAGLPLPH
jgi:uncharacterized protein YicC (UPF0701 family)